VSQGPLPAGFRVQPGTMFSTRARGFRGQEGLVSEGCAFARGAGEERKWSGPTGFSRRRLWLVSGFGDRLAGFFQSYYVHLDGFPDEALEFCARNYLSVPGKAICGGRRLWIMKGVRRIPNQRRLARLSHPSRPDTPGTGGSAPQGTSSHRRSPGYTASVS